MGWLHSSNRAMGSEASGDPAVIAKASGLAQEWLQAVGWVGQDCLLEKMAILTAIWADVQATVTLTKGRT